MAIYTTQVKTICESLCGYDSEQGFNNVNSVLEKSHKLIFDFDYPFYLDDGKDEFEKKFLLHFYMREIGLETYGYWKLRLQSKLQEIMPYYRSLFQQTTGINYFDNNNYHQSIVTNEHGNMSSNKTETQDISKNDTTHNINSINNVFSATKDTTSQGTSDISSQNEYTDNLSASEDEGINVKNDNLHKYSKYPQSSLDDFLNNIYLTDLTQDDGTTVTSDNITKKSDKTGNATGSQDTSYNEIKKDIEENSRNIEANTNNVLDSSTNVQHDSLKTDFTNLDTKLDKYSKGKYGGLSYIELLAKYKDAIINIDKLIFNECEELFMQLWR